VHYNVATVRRRPAGPTFTDTFDRPIRRCWTMAGRR
jgi:hypothetical protein